MVFACKPIVAENFLVLQILNEGKGLLTNKQSKWLNFKPCWCYLGKHELIIEEQFLEYYVCHYVRKIFFS